MKKCLLGFSILISICLLSNNTFGQNDTGGSAGATVVLRIQPIGQHFTRHNGQGAVPGESLIKLYYDIAPTYPPTLLQIYYEGLPLSANFIPVAGDISLTPITGYVTFSVPTNIPAGVKLTLQYYAGPWQPLVSVNGTE